MTNKDIEKLFEESNGPDMSHIKKDDILAKAKQELYFGSPAEEAPKKEKSALPSFFSKKRLIPTLAGVALAVTIFAGSIGLYNENFQTVYIDINPSVALKLNRFERVIGVEYLNEDAATLLSNVKLVGCDASDALTTVINACNSAGYVKSDSEIYISAEANNTKDSEKLLNKLKSKAETARQDESDTYAVNTYNAKKEEKENYKKEELSPAKYNIIHEIIDEDDDYELSDLRHKSMDELNKIKKNLDRDDDLDDDDDDDDDHKGAHGKFDNDVNGDCNDDDCDDHDDDDDDDDDNFNEKENPHGASHAGNRK